MIIIGLYAKKGLISEKFILHKQNIDGIIPSIFIEKAKVLQNILGHSKISQTIDLYVHTEDDFKEEEMKKIANLF